MKNRDLIAWLQQRDPDEEISLAGSELAKLVYSETESDDGEQSDGPGAAGSRGLTAP